MTGSTTILKAFGFEVSFPPPLFVAEIWKVADPYVSGLIINVALAENASTSSIDKFFANKPFVPSTIST